MSSSPFTDFLLNEDTSKERKQKKDPLSFLKIDKDNAEPLKGSPFAKAVKLNTKGAFTREELGKMLPIVKKISPEFAEFLEGMLELKDLADKPNLSIRDMFEFAKKKGLVDYAKKQIVARFKDAAERYRRQLVGSGQKGGCKNCMCGKGNYQTKNFQSGKGKQGFVMGTKISAGDAGFGFIANNLPNNADTRATPSQMGL